MAKIRLKLKPGDQKPFTRYNARKCTIATAAKSVYGGTVTATDTLVIRRGGRTWTLRVGADGQQVEAAHDAGNRVGARTITLYGKPPPTLAEQAGAANKARDARAQARAARKTKAAERAEAAEQARKQAAQRPAARQQPRTGERARAGGEAERQRARARVQEAEARERLRASEPARPVPQPRAAEPARTAGRPDARAPQPRTPRAIEPPKPALRWLLRNPFARPEPEAQPAHTRRTA